MNRHDDYLESIRRALAPVTGYGRRPHPGDLDQLVADFATDHDFDGADTYELLLIIAVDVRRIADQLAQLVGARDE